MVGRTYEKLKFLQKKRGSSALFVASLGEENENPRIDGFGLLGLAGGRAGEEEQVRPPQEDRGPPQRNCRSLCSSRVLKAPTGREDDPELPRCFICSIIVHSEVARIDLFFIYQLRTASVFHSFCQF